MWLKDKELVMIYYCINKNTMPFLIVKMSWELNNMSGQIKREFHTLYLYKIHIHTIIPALNITQECEISKSIKTICYKPSTICYVMLCYTVVINIQWGGY